MIRRLSFMIVAFPILSVLVFILVMQIITRRIRGIKK